MEKRLTIAAMLTLCAFLCTGMLYAGDPLAEMGIKYIFKDASITGNVRETVVEYTLECTLEVFERKSIKFPLIDTQVSLTDYKVVEGDDDDLVFIADEKGISLISLDDGEYRIHVTYVTSAEIKDGRAQTTVPLIPSVKSRTVLTIPGTDVNVTAAKGAGLKTEETGGGLKVEIFAPGQRMMPLIWWEEKKRDETIQAMATCEELVSALIGRAGIQLVSQMGFNIIQGKMETLSVDIDTKLNLLDVKGKGISYWNLHKKQDGQTLEVVFAQPVSGNVSLNVISEAGIKEIPSLVSVPSVVPQGAKKVSGYLAVFLEKGLKIDVAKSSDIRQIDVSTLPSSMSKKGYVPSLGFRFIQKAFDLSVSVGDITPRVFATVFTRAKIGLQSIKASTVIHFDIKNAGVFGFSIKLPAGLKLLDIAGENINSWNVKDNIITVDLRSRALGAYSLELLTDMQVNDPSGTLFPAVSVRSVESERGYIEIEPAPGMKIKAKKMDECNQIDRIELPGEFKQLGSAAQNALFFRYIRHPFSLLTAVEHIQPEISAHVENLIRVEERGLEVTYRISYAVEKAGVYNLEMDMDPEIMVIDVNGSSIDMWEKKGSKLKVVLQKKVKGTYSLFLSCEKPLKSLIPSISIPYFSLKNVKKEKGTVGITVGVPVKILEHPAGLKDIREVEIKTVDRRLRAAGIVRAYRYYTSPWNLELKTRTIFPRIKAEVFNFISVGRGGGACAVTFEFDIQDAQASEFVLKFPPQAENVTIKGTDAKPMEKTGPGTYKVTTHSGKIGRYNLFANFRIPLKKDSTFSFAHVEAAGVEHQAGYIVVSASNEMEVKLKNLEELVQMDYDEIDSRFKVGITDPVVLSFRYVDRDYSLGLDTVTHLPAEVVVAVIEAAKAYSSISENGAMVTDIFFKVRNTTEQFLRLKLPERSEIHHLIVNGRKMSPKQGQDRTLIPVSGVGGKAKEFRIYLRYKSDIDKLERSGSLEIPFPSTEMKILQLGWTLDFPEKYRLTPGTCENIDRVEYFHGMLSGLNAEYTEQAEKQRKQALNAPDQGQGSGYHADNIRAAQYSSYINARKGGSGQSVYTGKMPESGHTEHFMSIFPMDNQVTVRVSYVKSSMGNVMLILLAAAVFAVVYGACMYGPFSPKLKAAAVLAAAAVIGVVLVGAESLNPYLVTIGISCVAGGLGAGFAGLTLRKKPLPQESIDDMEIPEEDTGEDIASAPPSEQEPYEETPGQDESSDTEGEDEEGEDEEADDNPDQDNPLS